MNSAFPLFSRAEDGHMDMGSDPDAEPFTIASRSAIIWETLHIVTLMFVTCIIYSISVPLTLKRRRKLSLPIQIAVAGFCLADWLVFSFPDITNKESEWHEEAASRFTGFLLFILGCATAGLGLLTNVPGVGSRYTGLGSSVRLESGRLWLIERMYFIVATVAFPLVAYVRCGLAVVSMLGFCRGVHLGQCLAHGIMGSSFIIYGGYYLIMLLVAHGALRRSGRSQELYDSIVITAWGIINTFTEHRWGEPWSHGDFQHTSMGIIWWCGGMVGVYLSRNNRRSFIPALVLIFTGFAMAEHVQHLAISTKIHYVFGLALMLSGAARIVEISFLLDDAAEMPDGKVRSFQYLPCFGLIESGMLFQGANEEQLELLNTVGIDHSSYILVISSISFLIALWMLLLINLYLYLGREEPGNGYRRANGLWSAGQVRGAEEGYAEVSGDGYELESLADEEGEREGERGDGKRGLESGVGGAGGAAGGSAGTNGSEGSEQQNIPLI